MPVTLLFQNDYDLQKDERKLQERSFSIIRLNDSAC